jgi:hypothetical protein
MTTPKGGRQCTVCAHPDREAIDQDVVLKKGSLKDIAFRYRKAGFLGPDAIGRHRDNHLSEQIRREIIAGATRERAKEVDDQINEDVSDLEGGLQRIIRELDALLARAKANEDDGMALASLRELRSTMMDLARLYGQLKEVSTFEVRILEAPQWAQLRAILGEVFQQHPAAGQLFIQKTRQLQLTMDA